MKQMKLSKEFKFSQPFGGDLLTKRKGRTARPLSTKKAMHVVLRSAQATGAKDFRTGTNKQIIDGVLNKQARKFGVRIYDLANGGNHLHLIIKLGNRFTYAAFIRGVTGALALKIGGASKGRKLKARFWDRRPFSRVIEWGKAFGLAKDYLHLNKLEGAGIFEYSKNRLKDTVLFPFGRAAPVRGL